MILTGLFVGSNFFLAMGLLLDALQKELRLDDVPVDHTVESYVSEDAIS